MIDINKDPVGYIEDIIANLGYTKRAENRELYSASKAQEDLDKLTTVQSEIGASEASAVEKLSALSKVLRMIEAITNTLRLF